LIALGRHTVSALLSSATSSVNSGSTPQQVINAFTTVFPRRNYETLKNKFAADNERQCPLN